MPLISQPGRRFGPSQQEEMPTSLPSAPWSVASATAWPHTDHSTMRGNHRRGSRARKPTRRIVCLFRIRRHRRPSSLEAYRFTTGRGRRPLRGRTERASRSVRTLPQRAGTAFPLDRSTVPALGPMCRSARARTRSPEGPCRSRTSPCPEPASPRSPPRRVPSHVIRQRHGTR